MWSTDHTHHPFLDTLIYLVTERIGANDCYFKFFDIKPSGLASVATEKGVADK